MAGNQIVINVDIGETRVAIIENGIVSELHIERRGDRSVVGDVYLGKVTRVLPGMNAAFVDLGLERAAFLHVDDALPDEELRAAMLDAEADDDDEPDVPEGDGAEGADSSPKEAKAKPRRQPQRQPREQRAQKPIRDLVREGQEIIVQVSKGPISTKGARVTSHISLPGRYVCLLYTSPSPRDRTRSRMPSSA